MRKSREQRQQAAIARAIAEGGDETATMHNVNVKLQDTVFAVVHIGGRAQVEEIAISHELSVPVVDMRGLKKVGRVSIRPSVGGPPIMTDLLLDHRNTFYWDYQNPGDASALIFEEVMIALDKAAEEKAWRPLQDTGAAEFLAECVFAFDECFAVARGGQTLIASKRPVFVLSMSARKLDAIMCDGFRDGFPGNSAFAYGPWKKALLRFGLEEFRALESVLACVRHDEPFWSVPEIKDRFDPEFLVDEIKKGSTILKPECYEAELTLFRDLAAAGLFDDPRSKELLEKISHAERDYQSLRYRERAPEFIALADHLNLTKIDRLRQFCLEARWPLKMSPLDLLIKRIKNSDWNAELVRATKKRSGEEFSDAT